MSTIQFFVNGKSHTVDPKRDGVYPETRLVDYIRDSVGLKGTKFMCREGGCGACVVSVQTIDPFTNTTKTRAVNSCLTPVLSVDGWCISTIESLGNRHDGLHPIQNELIKTGGLQCGFCTPGMVMNMYSLLQGNKDGLSKREIEDSFDGNICRCTGYRPILDAFKNFSVDGPCGKACADIEDVKKGCCKIQNGSTNGCCKSNGKTYLEFPMGEKYLNARTLNDAFEGMNSTTNYRIVCGNTSTGIYKHDGPYSLYIDISKIPELNIVKVDSKNGFTFGGCVSLSTAIAEAKKGSTIDGLHFGIGIAKHLRRIANVPVRNAGSLAGNLMIKHDHHDFPSDLFVVLETLGAMIEVAERKHCNILGSNAKTTKLLPSEFIFHDMKNKLIIAIHIAPLDKTYIYRSFKISRRFQNAHAYINAGFLFNVDKEHKYKVISKPRIVYGGVNHTFIHASKAEEYFIGKSLLDVSTISGATKILEGEIKPDENITDGTQSYRLHLTQSLLYKTILGIIGEKSLNSRIGSGGKNIVRNLTKGTQSYDTNSNNWPINQPIHKIESIPQTSGEAEFVNDIPKIQGELYGVFVLSNQANAEIQNIDATEALKLPGVEKFICAKDIPGVNNYALPLIFPTNVEEIFAEKKVGYIGQSVGLILASTMEMANRAAKLVKIQYTNIGKPIIGIKDGLKAGGNENKYNTINQPAGVVGTNVIKGEMNIGSQYHFHMETQVCFCVPTEDGIQMYTSTQWMELSQAVVAKALNIPISEVHVQVRRLGGSYGAKAMKVGLLNGAAAVAAYATRRPVRICLDMETNMNMIGKRCPYSIQYESGFDNNGRIEYLKGHIVADNGYIINDEMPHETLSFFQNCYVMNNWNVEVSTVSTNTQSNTACRGPGTTQGIAFIENIMEHIAYTLKMDPLLVRQNNFVKDGDPKYPTLFGLPQTFEGENYIPKMVEEIKKIGEIERRKAEILAFNTANRWKKRGLGIIPMRYKLNYFGLPYPTYVAIYQHDGTVAVSHGGTEMGQGMNTKVLQAVAYKLGIPTDLIRIKPSDTFISANGCVTGGSATSELVAYAATRACEMLLQRIEPIRAKLPESTTWADLIKACGQNMVDLKASYTTTAADGLKDYEIWAVNATEVEIDVLTGEHKITRVDLLEDAGESMSPEVDIGQMEGALVMGLGLWTTEKIVHDPISGKILTNNTWTYKVPEVRDIPEDLRITILKDAPNPVGVLRSKATGEPPLCTAVAVLFALKNAIVAARKDVGNTDWFQLDGPVTPDDIVNFCLTKSSEFVL